MCLKFSFVESLVYLQLLSSYTGNSVELLELSSINKVSSV